MNEILRNPTNPYRSTTIYRLTASLTPDFPTLNPFEKVDKARPLIFSFDYETPKNIDEAEYKQFFETMFITRNFNKWFKTETFEEWQLLLLNKMLEILPTYNLMLSQLFRNDLDEFLLTQDKYNSKTVSKGTSSNISKDSTSNSSKSKNIAANFPANLATAGTSIENVNYANNGDVNNVSGSTSSNGSNDGEHEDETTTETTRYYGNYLEQFMKYSSGFANIFTNLMHEFDALFASVLF